MKGLLDNIGSFVCLFADDCVEWPSLEARTLLPFHKIQCGAVFIEKDKYMTPSDSFTIWGLWVLGLAVSNINESPLQTNESKTLFFNDKSAILLHPGTRWDSLQ